MAARPATRPSGAPTPRALLLLLLLPLLPACVTGWAVDGLRRPRARCAEVRGAYVERGRLVVAASGPVEEHVFALVLPDVAVRWVTRLEYDLADDEPLPVRSWEAATLLAWGDDVPWEAPPGTTDVPVLSHDRVHDVVRLQVGPRERRARVAFEPGAGRRAAFGALLPLAVVADVALLPAYLVIGITILVAG